MAWSRFSKLLKAVSVGEYSVYHFGDMLADPGRVDAYLQALRQAMRPGSIVLDLGTGTGFFALKACDFGASKVYAIDPNSSIELARELAAANGRAEQIEFIQAMSTDVELPEQVDLIISDLRGITPLYGRHIDSISDARDRFLSEGGTLIPLRDELWCAPVRTQAGLEAYSVWTSEFHGLDMSAGSKYARNVWNAPRIQSSDLMAMPRRWSVLNYETISDVNVSGSVSWSGEDAFAADGLCLWFEAILSENASFTSGPTRPGGPTRTANTYRRAFYPFLESVQVEPGDELSVSIRGQRTDGLGGDYSWRWTTTLSDRAGIVKAAFDQSTLLSMPISRSKAR
ncbi:MAG: 50S ribosomal protein L11 methyltransferase [Acidimicrobiia bacterium]|nr:50S ribosomal protein L11 methyltransferase [Acidimicrobiia bacterium]